MLILQRKSAKNGNFCHFLQRTLPYNFSKYHKYQKFKSSPYKVECSGSNFSKIGKKLRPLMDLFTRSWRDSGHWKSGQKLKKWDKILIVDWNVPKISDQV